MSLTAAISMVCLLGMGPPDSGDWSFSASSEGEDVLWVAPTTIDATGQGYEFVYDITAATVHVAYLGVVFGPIDVMDMIPESAITTWESKVATTPMAFCTRTVVTPDPPEEPSLRYDWRIEVGAKGTVSYFMENLYFGQADYDLGWPWGSVTVDIIEGTITADLHVESHVEGCGGDTNNDDVADVVDLLNIIAAWGIADDGCYAEDLNDDDLVGVNDLLMVIAAWGACPP
jgi:hypothetical protein